jgi:hypothetical protein
MISLLLQFSKKCVSNFLYDGTFLAFYPIYRIGISSTFTFDFEIASLVVCDLEIILEFISLSMALVSVC